jgi:hypothetical protein
VAVVANLEDDLRIRASQAHGDLFRFAMAECVADSFLGNAKEVSRYFFVMDQDRIWTLEPAVHSVELANTRCKPAHAGH